MSPIARSLSPFPWRWWASCLVSLTLLLYWRRPDAFYNPQLWAEDGTVFFAQARLQSRPLLNVPYSGYYHVLARATAYVGNELPMALVPHWYTLASWLLLAGLVTYLFSARFTFPLWQRWLLGLALVAVPVDNEVFFNIANWATLTTVGWLLLVVTQEPRTRWEMGFDFGLLTLLGLNSPFTVCLWPLFWGRWAVRRNAFSGGLAVASGLVALGQVVNMLGRLQAESRGASGPLPPLSVETGVAWLSYMSHGFQTYWFKNDPWRLLGFGTGAILLGAWLLYTARRRDWAGWAWLEGGLLCGALSLFALRAVAPVILFTHTGRHFFLPVVCLTWALIISPSRWAWPFWAVIFGVFLFATPGMKNEIRQDLQLGARLAACEADGWAHPCRIPIHPLWAEWVVLVAAPAQVPPLTTGPAHLYLPVVER